MGQLGWRWLDDGWHVHDGEWDAYIRRTPDGWWDGDVRFGGENHWRAEGCDTANECRETLQSMLPPEDGEWDGVFLALTVSCPEEVPE